MTRADLETLAAAHGIGFRVVRDESAPMLFAVWADGDILGAGDTESEALDEARQQLRAWESAS